MQSNILKKNSQHSIMLWTCFSSFGIRKLFWKNENWTFLKCPKVKNPTESW